MYEITMHEGDYMNILIRICICSYLVSSPLSCSDFVGYRFAVLYKDYQVLES